MKTEKQKRRCGTCKLWDRNGPQSGTGCCMYDQGMLPDAISRLGPFPRTMHESSGEMCPCHIEKS